MRFKEFLTEDSQFLKSKEEIHEWLEENIHRYNILRFKINDDLTVDVEGDMRIKVTAARDGMKLLPIKFGDVAGDVNFGLLKLVSLKGSPREVQGNFFCDGNLLTDLVGGPRNVGEIYDCANNKITSLKGSPREVGHDFDCSNNELLSLKGAPREIGGMFIATNNLFETEPDHSFVKIGDDFLWD